MKRDKPGAAGPPARPRRSVRSPPSSSRKPSPASTPAKPPSPRPATTRLSSSGSDAHLDARAAKRRRDSIPVAGASIDSAPRHPECFPRARPVGRHRGGPRGGHPAVSSRAPRRLPPQALPRRLAAATHRPPRTRRRRPVRRPRPALRRAAKMTLLSRSRSGGTRRTTPASSSSSRLATSSIFTASAAAHRERRRVLNIFAYQSRNYLTASVPVARLHVYVRRLVEAGHKVGVIRQTERRR